MNELVLTDITKHYRKQTILQHLSLTLRPGVTVLVGKNGSGKSTLLRIVSTLLLPTSGSLIWNGRVLSRSDRAFRRSLGFVPQDAGVYPHLSARQFLQYVAALKGIPKRSTDLQIDDLLAQFDLSSAASRPLGTFSGGMRQRVAIAQALLGDPSVLVVDEPTVGLDEEQREVALRLIAGVDRTRIVLMTTHRSDDIARIADRRLTLQSSTIAHDTELIREPEPLAI